MTITISGFALIAFWIVCGLMAATLMNDFWSKSHPFQYKPRDWHRELIGGFLGGPMSLAAAFIFLKSKSGKDFTIGRKWGSDNSYMSVTEGCTEGTCGDRIYMCNRHRNMIWKK